jgi:hypothetical protein
LPSLPPQIRVSLVPQEEPQAAFQAQVVTHGGITSASGGITSASGGISLVQQQHQQQHRTQFEYGHSLLQRAKAKQEERLRQQLRSSPSSTASSTSSSPAPSSLSVANHSRSPPMNPSLHARKPPTPLQKLLKEPPTPLKEPPTPLKEPPTPLQIRLEGARLHAQSQLAEFQEDQDQTRSQVQPTSMSVGQGAITNPQRAPAAGASKKGTVYGVALLERAKARRRRLQQLIEQG